MWGWRFLVDECGFAFRVLEPAVVDNILAQFLDLLEYIRESDGIVMRSEILFEIQSVDGRELHEVLTSADFDRDLRHELFRRLDKIGVYDANPPGLDIIVDGRLMHMAPSAALGLSLTADGRSMACLTTEVAEISGAREVRVYGSELAGIMHFLVNRSDGPAYWRDLFYSEPDSVVRLASHSHLPFPNTVFAASVWNQLDSFAGSLRDVWPRLLHNLAGLDDHAVRIWDQDVESDKRQRLMSSIAGVDCSPESARTHRNRGAMRQRRVRFGDREIVCEWHAKLEPHRNRVHFAVKDDQVYVGRFDNHLTT
ncbi:hypothetical protein [Nocardia arizonensis]|uniref:hypothetical protein n=1 Tax=Nocardia arizonensis TaxID=1141647 RepID=UPI000A782271|nr:hypothetical protein [Nocardia arizonensis]